MMGRRNGSVNLGLSSQFLEGKGCVKFTCSLRKLMRHEALIRAIISEKNVLRAWDYYYYYYYPYDLIKMDI